MFDGDQLKIGYANYFYQIMKLRVSLWEGLLKAPRRRLFCDLVGKPDILNVECDTCGRRGRYRLDRLIERYGGDAKLFDWSDEITADCRRKQAMNLNDICGARCPDLSKVV